MNINRAKTDHNVGKKRNDEGFVVTSIEMLQQQPILTADFF
jgi:hypothetical protein